MPMPYRFSSTGQFMSKKRKYAGRVAKGALLGGLGAVALSRPRAIAGLQGRGMGQILKGRPRVGMGLIKLAKGGGKIGRGLSALRGLARFR